MSESDTSPDDVASYLEQALDADPKEKDFHIRHVLQAVASMQEVEREEE